MHYRFMMHVILAILSICTALSQSAVAQTRLGLHVTQEELTIWRQRLTDNVNRVNGYSFQSIYQNRILADANVFRSQAHPGGDGFWGGYTGSGCVPLNNQSVKPGSGGTPYGRGNGAYLMRSAFNFLLTGDRSYADPVRTELLNQIAQPGTDWTNTGKWCYTQLGGGNMLEIIPWVVRLMIAFDYLNAGGYTGFTATEKTNITNWLSSAVTVWDQAQRRIIADSNYPGIYSTPQNLTCVNCPGTIMNNTYFNGYPVYTATYYTYFNQLWDVPVLTMGMGLMTNNATWINRAVAYATAFLKAGIYDNGAVTDFTRWVDCTPTCPRSMWAHAEGPVSGLIAVADMYARSGNTSLYTLTAPTQVLGGSGGTVGLVTILRLLANMNNHTVSYYGTTDPGKLNASTLLAWNSQGDMYWDFSSMVANLYYQDSTIRSAMERNLLSGNTSGGCVDPQYGGCFSAVYSGVWADLPFMFGQMEGKVQPYSQAETTLSSPQNLRVTPMFP